MKNKRVMKLASRGKRLGAYCIDAAIPFAVFVILMIASGSANRYRSFRNDPFGGYGFGYGYGYGNGFGNDFGYGYGNNSPQLSNALVALVSISMLVFLAYLIVQLVFFSKSKTIGKAALGMQVVSSENGKPIGFWMMLLREWIVKSASSRVFMLGYIWVLIDDRNRGWHDKILDTYVVDLKESEALNRPKRTVQEVPEDEAFFAEKPDSVITEPEKPNLPVPKEPELPVIVESSKSEEYIELENKEDAEQKPEEIKGEIEAAEQKSADTEGEIGTIKEAAEETVERTDEKDL